MCLQHRGSQHQFTTSIIWHATQLKLQKLTPSRQQQQSQRSSWAVGRDGGCSSIDLFNSDIVCTMLISSWWDANGSWRAVLVRMGSCSFRQSWGREEGLLLISTSANERGWEEVLKSMGSELRGIGAAVSCPLSAVGWYACVQLVS